AYWGTPVIPISYAGAFAKGGVISGTAVSTFDGSLLGPVTFDTRTQKANYNVLNNSVGSQELWLRSGFEWTPTSNLTVKRQAYVFDAKRHWLDSETYAFSFDPVTPGKPIDRDRFFVGHNQRLYGSISDLLFDSRPLGMENRFAARL